ncbi:MAG: diguanylate cyclase [Kangiellaceae bacterium]|nr:diguanylate cyclase [Kangiellaceae bacterium]
MMSNNIDQLREFHWMMDMLQNIDVGLVVLNKNNEIQLWNSFMENHSGLIASNTRNKDLFELFPEIEKDWFQHKVESVFQLKTRAFSIWEQRPYIFKFKNYRPITGIARFMYQNISIFPIVSTTGEVDNICIIVYDVTDIATNRDALSLANKQLEELSRTDRLTGLNNRGYWQERQEAEFARNQRYKNDTSLVIFDIDHFKKVNDTHGHQAGDEVIRQCSAALKECARDVDICGRYGGEEFVVILSEANSKQAMIFAERLRLAIEALEVKYKQIEIKFTVSLGICGLTEEVETAQHWLEKADNALYESKENGRNKTTLAN